MTSPELGHVGDRHDDLEVPLLGRRRLHDRRPGRPPARKRATSSTGRTVADSPTRWAGRSSRRVEPLEAEREVGAALGAGDGVHLVEDDRLDPGERLAGLRR